MRERDEPARTYRRSDAGVDCTPVEQRCAASYHWRRTARTTDDSAARMRCLPRDSGHTRREGTSRSFVGGVSAQCLHCRTLSESAGGARAVRTRCAVVGARHGNAVDRDERARSARHRRLSVLARMSEMRLPSALHAAPGSGAELLSELGLVLYCGAGIIFIVVVALALHATFAKPSPAGTRAWIVGGGIVFPLL